MPFANDVHIDSGANPNPILTKRLGVAWLPILRQAWLWGNWFRWHWSLSYREEMRDGKRHRGLHWFAYRRG